MIGHLISTSTLNFVRSLVCSSVDSLLLLSHFSPKPYTFDHPSHVYILWLQFKVWSYLFEEAREQEMTKVRTWEILTCKTHVERTTESLNSKRVRKWHVTIMYTLHAFVCVCEGMSQGVRTTSSGHMHREPKKGGNKVNSTERTKGVKKKTMHLFFWLKT